MDSDTLSSLFAAFLVATLAVKFWLASRQIRYVARHRNAVPAGFVQTITPAAHQRAADYTITKTRFGLLTTAFGAAVLLGWTLLGGLDVLNAAVRDAVQPTFGDLAYQLALLAAVAVIGALLDLPFDAWATFRIEQRFGFNRMSWRLFLGDLAKSALLGAALGLPLAAAVLWVMGATGSQWWLWAWAVWVGFSLLMLVIGPTLIAPLFNKFEPLADDGLRQRVEGLLARCGFAAKGLFVMDGSKRSAHANAYFTGFGSAKRVVFFDTLLNKLSPGEVEAVLAHELGHFKRRHVLKRMIGIFGMSLAGFALLGWLSNQAWFYTGLGVQPNLAAPNDALALLLFMMAGPVFGYFVSPLMAAVSRRHEYEADAYACAQASWHDLSNALLKLYEDNAATLTPDPWYVRFYYSHPPAVQRLAAMKALTT
jgi:STE24 endopeptidase